MVRRLWAWVLNYDGVEGTKVIKLKSKSLLHVFDEGDLWGDEIGCVCGW